MQAQKPNRTIGRRGKVFLTLAVVLGTLGVLLYFEQLEIIYIGSTLALIILLILVAFSDLETIGVNAAEEAYMTRKSEGVFPDDEADREPYFSKSRRSRRSGGTINQRPGEYFSNVHDQ